VQPRYVDPKDMTQLTPGTKRLTGKQVKFIELLATGMAQQDAAKQAGLLNRSSCYRTLTNPLAIQYLSAIRAETRAIVAYDVGSAMQEAMDDHKFAVEKGNAMAAVKATELRAKLSGLLIDRVEIATVDLTGALQRAEQRVLSIPASAHTPQALPQADTVNRVNP
jgi:succinate dehydrogenase/fumarate reductase flavoprotein subunit